MLCSVAKLTILRLLWVLTDTLRALYISLQHIASEKASSTCSSEYRASLSLLCTSIPRSVNRWWIHCRKVELLVNPNDLTIPDID